jgi:hypothetical protein
LFYPESVIFLFDMAPWRLRDALSKILLYQILPCQAGGAHHLSKLFPQARRTSSLNNLPDLSRMCHFPVDMGPLSFKDSISKILGSQILPCQEGGAHHRSQSKSFVDSQKLTATSLSQSHVSRD